VAAPTSKSSPSSRTSTVTLLADSTTCTEARSTPACFDTFSASWTSR
jgi:hypothetical protein